MATPGLTPFRQLSARPTNVSRLVQRRWAQVYDVRFVATQQVQGRIADRYKHLLEEKAKREGLQNVHQLKEVYKDKIHELRKSAIVPGATGPPPERLQFRAQRPSRQQNNSGRPGSHTDPPPLRSDEGQPRTSPSSKTPGLKTLSAFLDVEKTMELPQREIESIWRLRHAHSKQSICAAIPADIFSAIYKTARIHPQFVLPGLPQKQGGSDETPEIVTQEGAPIHFMQWTFPGPDTVTVLFTHLAEYKLRGEYAQPHTSLTHHLELAQPKGLVLCQGSVIPGRGVSVEEGKWLVLCMQKFYNTKELEEIEADQDSSTGKDLKRKRRQLIEQFNTGDSGFRIEDLLDHADRLG